MCWVLLRATQPTRLDSQDGIYKAFLESVMKKNPIIQTLQIIALVLMVPSTIYTSIMLIDWLFKSDSKIQIYYSIDKDPLQLPKDVKLAFARLNRKGKKDIEIIEKSLRQSNKDNHLDVDNLISILEGLTSNKVFEYVGRPKVVWNLEVQNVGTKTARNLNILLPGIGGYVEVFEEGKLTIKKEIKDKLFFPQILPDTVIQIQYWTSDFNFIRFRNKIYDRKIKASYDNGVVKVIKRTVLRTNKNYVFEFDRLFFTLNAMIVFFLLMAALLFLLRVFDKSSQNSIKKLDE